MSDVGSDASREFKRVPPRLRVMLSAAEQVAVVGALQRDLELPDTDHETLRNLIARLTP